LNFHGIGKQTTKVTTSFSWCLSHGIVMIYAKFIALENPINREFLMAHEIS